MIAASEPKMKKSYHSKTVPAADAATTRPSRRPRGSAVSPADSLIDRSSPLAKS